MNDLIANLCIFSSDKQPLISSSIDKVLRKSSQWAEEKCSSLIWHLLQWRNSTREEKNVLHCSLQINLTKCFDNVRDEWCSRIFPMKKSSLWCWEWEEIDLAERRANVESESLSSRVWQDLWGEKFISPLSVKKSNRWIFTSLQSFLNNIQSNFELFQWKELTVSSISLSEFFFCLSTNDWKIYWRKMFVCQFVHSLRWNIWTFNEEKKENFLLNFDEEVRKSSVNIESIVLLFSPHSNRVRSSLAKVENDQRPFSSCRSSMKIDESEAKNVEISFWKTINDLSTWLMNLKICEEEIFVVFRQWIIGENAENFIELLLTVFSSSTFWKSSASASFQQSDNTFRHQQYEKKNFCTSSLCQILSVSMEFFFDK